ncbi:MAG: hypothetical protein ACSLEL_00355 [Candidatus Malihini olakiniferum]
MGNKEQILAGKFQIMSAGTGIRCSECNASRMNYCTCILLDHSGKDEYHSMLRAKTL